MSAKNSPEAKRARRVERIARSHGLEGKGLDEEGLGYALQGMPTRAQIRKLPRRELKRRLAAARDGKPLELH